MQDNPTYEQLAQRVRELEKTVSGRIRTGEILNPKHDLLEITESMANIGSWEWDAFDDRAYWSKQLFRIFGRDPAEGAPPFASQSQLYENGDITLLREGVEQCIKHGTPYEIEVRAIRSDGEVRHCIAKGQPQYDRNGQVIRLVGSFQDITERKQAEVEIIKNANFTASLLQAIPTPVFYKDKTGRYLGCNNAFTKIMGVTSDQIKGKTVQELWPGKHANIYHQKDLELMQNPRHQVYEFEITDKDGTIRPVLYAKDVFRDESGNVAGLLGAFLDITERKQAEQTLHRYEQIISSTNDLMSFVDKGYRYQAVNEAYLKAHKKQRGDIIGYSVEQLAGKETFLKVIKAYFDRALNGEAAKYQAWFDYDGIGRRFMDVTYHPVETEDKEPHGVVVCAHDMTELKLAEDERSRLQDQLVQAQKMESVGRLAGGLAHDFNNMLGVILGNTELALKHLDPADPTANKLKRIHQTAKRTSRLTSQLLGFASKQTIAPRIVNLNEIVDGLLKILRRLIGENIDLSWMPKSNLWPVKLDPAQVDQILTNLLVNARDSIGDVGKVTIETDNVSIDPAIGNDHIDAIPGKYVMIAVRDTGMGMDKETLQHIFEPFFTTKKLGKGTGLGLSNVYGIVKQNNGFLKVVSETNQGSCFRIYFPKQAEIIRTDQNQKPEPSYPSGTETILLVEDDKDVLSMTTEMLRQLGYKVLPTSLPNACIEIAESHPGPIHLLLTDVVMPEMNGRDLAKRIMHVYPSIKCLFMSGYTSDVIAHHGILDDDIQFIQKPFSIEDLSAKTRNVLDMGKGQLV
jgi:PAS domain S-box-containing protein